MIGAMKNAVVTNVAAPNRRSSPRSLTSWKKRTRFGLSSIRYSAFCTPSRASFALLYASMASSAGSKTNSGIAASSETKTWLPMT